MKFRKLTPNSGFTLVELLVVIAIIGILVALLLPAVQKARESAQLMQCKSNMRNIALALHNYHSAHQHFPQGFDGEMQRNEMWGWSAYLLPYLEETALYEQLGVSEQRLMDFFAANANDPQMMQIAQTPLAIYRCPTDSTPPLLPVSRPGDRHFNGNNTPQGYEPPTSNYVGIKGFFDSGCRSDRAVGSYPPKYKGGNLNQAFKPNCNSDGIFFGDSEVSMKNIKDGTSKTFMLGERDFRAKAGTYIGSRNPPGNGMWGSYMLIARVSMALNHPIPTANSEPADDAQSNYHNTATEGCSSSHAGGATFAFADGSVHFISEDIDFDNGSFQIAIYPREVGVYQRLGIRNDGVIIDEEY